MSKYASKVVEQARAWLGKKESDGSFKEIIDVYNSHKPLARGYMVKYTDEWCSTFVSAVAVKLGYTDIIPTECGCEKHILLFKNIGAWVENENRVPNAGDIIFYDWRDNGVGDNTGSADHVGIVEKVEGSTITVIEGNYNSSVARRTLSVNGKYIRGYGVPKYDKEQTKNEKVNVYYKVKTQKHGWLGEVKNYNDNDAINGYAGWENSPIVGLAVKVDKGSIKYRVHVKGGKWLGWITKYDVKDYNYGYAGNNKPIDAIQIYYYTPDNIRPYKKAKYKVNDYDWQYDTETTGNQDGYGGLIGVNATKIQITIE